MGMGFSDVCHYLWMCHYMGDVVFWPRPLHDFARPEFMLFFIRARGRMLLCGAGFYWYFDFDVTFSLFFIPLRLRDECFGSLFGMCARYLID